MKAAAWRLISRAAPAGARPPGPLSPWAIAQHLWAWALDATAALALPAWPLAV